MSDPFGISKGVSRERRKRASAVAAGSAVAGAGIVAGPRLTQAGRLLSGSAKMHAHSVNSLYRGKDALARAGKTAGAGLDDAIRATQGNREPLMRRIAEATEQAENAGRHARRSEWQSKAGERLAGSAKRQAKGTALPALGGAAAGGAAGGATTIGAGAAYDEGRKRVKKFDDKDKYGAAGAAIGGGAAAAAFEPTDRVARNKLSRAKAAEKAQARRLAERSGKVPAKRIAVETQKLENRKAATSAARKAKYFARLKWAPAAGAAAAGGAMLADDLRQKVKKNDPFGISKGNVNVLNNAEGYIRYGMQRAARAGKAKEVRDTTSAARQAATDAVSGPRKATSSRVSEAWAGKTSQANEAANNIRTGSNRRRNLYLVGGGAAGAGAAGAGGAYAYRQNQR